MGNLNNKNKVVSLIFIVIISALLGVVIVASSNQKVTYKSRASGACEEGQWRTQCLEPRDRQNCNEDAGVEQVFECENGDWAYKYPQCSNSCAVGDSGGGGEVQADAACQGKNPGDIIQDCVRDECDTNLKKYVCIQQYCDNNLKVTEKTGSVQDKVCGGVSEGETKDNCPKGSVIENCVRQDCDSSGYYVCIQSYWDDNCTVKYKPGTLTSNSCVDKPATTTASPTISWGQITPQADNKSGIFFTNPTPTFTPTPIPNRNASYSSTSNYGESDDSDGTYNPFTADDLSQSQPTEKKYVTIKKREDREPDAPDFRTLNECDAGCPDQKCEPVEFNNRIYYHCAAIHMKDYEEVVEGTEDLADYCDDVGKLYCSSQTSLAVCGENHRVLEKQCPENYKCFDSGNTVATCAPNNWMPKIRFTNEITLASKVENDECNNEKDVCGTNGTCKQSGVWAFMGRGDLRCSSCPGSQIAKEGVGCVDPDSSFCTAEGPPRKDATTGICYACFVPDQNDPESKNKLISVDTRLCDEYETGQRDKVEGGEIIANATSSDDQYNLRMSAYGKARDKDDRWLNKGAITFMQAGDMFGQAAGTVFSKAPQQAISAVGEQFGQKWGDADAEATSSMGDYYQTNAELNAKYGERNMWDGEMVKKALVSGVSGATELATGMLTLGLVDATSVTNQLKDYAGLDEEDKTRGEAAKQVASDVVNTAMVIVPVAKVGGLAGNLTTKAGAAVAGGEGSGVVRTVVGKTIQATGKAVSKGSEIAEWTSPERIGAGFIKAAPVTARIEAGVAKVAQSGTAQAVKNVTSKVAEVSKNAGHAVAEAPVVGVVAPAAQGVAEVVKIGGAAVAKTAKVATEVIMPRSALTYTPEEAASLVIRDIKNGVVTADKAVERASSRYRVNLNQTANADRFVTALGKESLPAKQIEGLTNGLRNKGIAVGDDVVTELNTKAIPVKDTGEIRQEVTSKIIKGGAVEGDKGLAAIKKELSKSDYPADEIDTAARQIQQEATQQKSRYDAFNLFKKDKTTVELISEAKTTVNADEIKKIADELQDIKVADSKNPVELAEAILKKWEQTDNAAYIGNNQQLTQALAYADEAMKLRPKEPSSVSKAVTGVWDSTVGRFFGKAEQSVKITLDKVETQTIDNLVANMDPAKATIRDVRDAVRTELKRPGLFDSDIDINLVKEVQKRLDEKTKIVVADALSPELKSRYDAFNSFKESADSAGQITEAKRTVNQTEVNKLFNEIEDIKVTDTNNPVEIAEAILKKWEQIDNTSHIGNKQQLTQALAYADEVVQKQAQFKRDIIDYYIDGKVIPNDDGLAAQLEKKGYRNDPEFVASTKKRLAEERAARSSKVETSVETFNEIETTIAEKFIYTTFTKEEVENALRSSGYPEDLVGHAAIKIKKSIEQSHKWQAKYYRDKGLDRGILEQGLIKDEATVARLKALGFAEREINDAFVKAYGDVAQIADEAAGSAVSTVTEPKGPGVVARTVDNLTNSFTSLKQGIDQRGGVTQIVGNAVKDTTRKIAVRPASFAKNMTVDAATFVGSLTRSGGRGTLSLSTRAVRSAGDLVGETTGAVYGGARGLVSGGSRTGLDVLTTSAKKAARTAGDLSDLAGEAAGGSLTQARRAVEYTRGKVSEGKSVVENFSDNLRVGAEVQERLGQALKPAPPLPKTARSASDYAKELMKDPTRRSHSNSTVYAIGKGEKGQSEFFAVTDETASSARFTVEVTPEGQMMIRDHTVLDGLTADEAFKANTAGIYRNINGRYEAFAREIPHEINHGDIIRIGQSTVVRVERTADGKIAFVDVKNPNNYVFANKISEGLSLTDAVNSTLDLLLGPPGISSPKSTVSSQKPVQTKSSVPVSKSTSKPKAQSPKLNPQSKVAQISNDMAYQREFFNTVDGVSNIDASIEVLPNGSMSIRDNSEVFHYKGSDGKYYLYKKGTPYELRSGDVLRIGEKTMVEVQKMSDGSVFLVNKSTGGALRIKGSDNFVEGFFQAFQSPYVRPKAQTPDVAVRTQGTGGAKASTKQNVPAVAKSPSGQSASAKKPVEPVKQPAKSPAKVEVNVGTGALQKEVVSGHEGVIQDYIHIRPTANGQKIIAVADGVSQGGAQSAKVAQDSSKLMASKMETALEKYGTDYAAVYRYLNEEAKILNKEIRAKYPRSASTIVVSTVTNDGKLITFRIGDAEARIITGGKIAHIDKLIHADGSNLFLGSFVPPEKSYGSIIQTVKKNLPYQIGGNSFEGRLAVHSLKKGDRMIFTSDGIAKVLKEEEINKIVFSAKTPEEAEKALIKAALDNADRLIKNSKTGQRYAKGEPVDDLSAVVVFY